jgi:hypothetical protein
MRMPDPGTKVPGYFHRVPTGRKMAELQLPFGPQKITISRRAQNVPIPKMIFRRRHY